MIKMSLFITRRSDLTREQFNDYWLNKHWPIVQTVPEAKKYTRRYVQLHNLGETSQDYAALPFNGVAEAWLVNCFRYQEILSEVVNANRIQGNRSERVWCSGKSIKDSGTSVQERRARS